MAFGLTVLGAEAVVHGADAGVGVGGEVDPCQVAGEGDERADQAGVLVRVAWISACVRTVLTIVLLSPKSTGLDVGQASDIASPLGLHRHLDKLGVLLNHSSDDAEETVDQPH